MLNQIRNIYDFAALKRRIDKRAHQWAKQYQVYRKHNREAPLPAVLQLIPTEHCNMRCPMCNQWGETGYYLTKKRHASHMPIEKLLPFLDQFGQLQPDYTLSLHGGEPLVYKQLPQLLTYIEKNRLDTLFSTNGVLIGEFADQLARINRHTFYLLSIDGGEKTHDAIRGAGTTKKIIAAIGRLKEECQKRGTGLPKLIINYCICEHNPEDIEEVVKIARQLNAWLINYNLRWFMPSSAGQEYNKILQREYQLTPTNAWTGWVVDKPFENIKQAIDKVLQISSPLKQLRPPYYTTIPKGLTPKMAMDFYNNYSNIFGIKSCIMPSYWARIHSNGDLIYCPGHPDIIPGNVFNTPFKELYYNKISTQLRQQVEKRLLPICNRCCGLYMTYPATKLLDKEFGACPS